MVRNRYNTPGIIKYSFWQQVYRNSNATYVRLKMNEERIPAEIQDRAIQIRGDSSDIIHELID